MPDRGFDGTPKPSAAGGSVEDTTHNAAARFYLKALLPRLSSTLGRKRKRFASGAHPRSPCRGGPGMEERGREGEEGGLKGRDNKRQAVSSMPAEGARLLNLAHHRRVDGRQRPRACAQRSLSTCWNRSTVR
jgi:hypothetical protein